MDKEDAELTVAVWRHPLGMASYWLGWVAFVAALPHIVFYIWALSKVGLAELDPLRGTGVTIPTAYLMLATSIIAGVFGVAGWYLEATANRLVRGHTPRRDYTWTCCGCGGAM